MSPLTGFICKNADQDDKYCQDYEARFCCPGGKPIQYTPVQKFRYSRTDMEQWRHCVCPVHVFVRDSQDSNLSIFDVIAQSCPTRNRHRIVSAGRLWVGFLKIYIKSIYKLAIHMYKLANLWLTSRILYEVARLSRIKIHRKFLHRFFKKYILATLFAWHAKYFAVLSYWFWRPV